MKMSWGHRILVVYLAFVAGILFLVYKANQEKFDLVTPGYYDAELKFQDIIDEKARVAALSAAPKISHSVNTVRIELPIEFSGRPVSGQLYLYRPSDASKDISKNFETSNNFVEISLNKNLSGMYEAKLSWQSGGKRFYHEQRIFF